MIAAFVGGRTDRIMMRLVDALQSLPLVVMVIFVVSLLGRSGAAERERVFFLVVGAVWWLSMARVVRSRVLVLRGSEFIACARTLGASPLRLLLRHLLPNVLPLVIVYLTLTIPSVLLFESFLSFLGLGIAPPRVSWGRLALEGAEAINPLTIPWWLVTFPALAMGTTLLALNFLGDGLRDALDPRRAGRGSQ
jgi:oligopeptide transport system permease protein